MIKSTNILKEFREEIRKLDVPTIEEYSKCVDEQVHELAFAIRMLGNLEEEYMEFLENKEIVEEYENTFLKERFI